jgi:hypothetical protein
MPKKYIVVDYNDTSLESYNIFFLGEVSQEEAKDTWCKIFANIFMDYLGYNISHTTRIDMDFIRLCSEGYWEQASELIYKISSHYRMDVQLLCVSDPDYGYLGKTECRACEILDTSIDEAKIQEEELESAKFSEFSDDQLLEEMYRRGI